MKKERAEFYEFALKEWGEDSQLWMCVEEMSELTKEICKYSRLLNSGADVVRLSEAKARMTEEIADVLNMAEQLSWIYGASEVEKIRDRKLRREKERQK